MTAETPAAPTRPLSRWTLRRRLVVGIVALLAAVSFVIGTVSVLTLQASLITKLDSQVESATQRAVRVADGGGPGGYPEGGSGNAPGPNEILPFAGLQPGSVVALSSGTASAGAVLNQSVQSTALTNEQVAMLLALPADVATTVNLGGDIGEYRAISATRADGDTIVIAMPLADVNATVRQLLVVIGSITAVGLLAAIFAGTAIVRVALRPLERVASTAARVSELPLERGEVALAVRVPDADADPRTEVGQVGAAINRMLGHVASALSARESSEKKLRTFVADASHELRTPLTSIRGYAELTRRGGHDLPADVVHALGRVESESVRMTSLVEDLLLLARLDDGRSLESAPVDLTRILADSVSDAYAASQDHDWIFQAPDEPVIVPGDAARLHQVVVNLLANARVHTPAGTQVLASVARVEGKDLVEITITDDGPGIDEAILPAVFERFARGDSSRSRTAGSTGLGLAIVAAIVDAHNGTVTVTSTPGATTFTVTLPA